MKRSPILGLCMAFIFFLPCRLHAQQISFEMLKGNWDVTGSRDLKIFSNNKLQFNSVDAHCYLKSTWTFDSDSTGFIAVNSSEKCPAPQTAKFRFTLFETAGYGGPMYKMDVQFNNGSSYKLALQTDDGKKKLKIGYNQALVESMATDNRVWIYFSMKKKS